MEQGTYPVQSRKSKCTEYAIGKGGEELNNEMEKSTTEFWIEKIEEEIVRKERKRILDIIRSYDGKILDREKLKQEIGACKEINNELW